MFSLCSLVYFVVNYLVAADNRAVLLRIRSVQMDTMVKAML